MFSQLNRYDKKEILTRTQLRKFETKLGELILCDAEKDLEKAIEETKAEYILFGIPEDIGIKANMGHGGADSAWFPFLDSFLNIQNNDFLSGQNIFLVGHYDFSEAEKLINVNADSEEEKIKAYRALVSRIDDAVEELVKVIVQCKKIPVIIGGGHNNAYPAIKGAAKGLYKTDMIPLSQINCVNLDPHTDYRSLEGRHSGNAFRYADEDGYLHKYYIIGVHENYLQENIMMDILSNPFIDYISYEDIFIRGKRNFIQAVAHAVEFTEDNYTGV
ncbi:MAG: arginase family protein, partial [Ginsengibacter sp.]